MLRNTVRSDVEHTNTIISADTEGVLCGMRNFEQVYFAELKLQKMLLLSCVN